MNILIAKKNNNIKSNNMGYSIDLNSIGIDIYKAKLESSYVLPSRVILKERLDERFNYFKSTGIKNVLELQQIFKNKVKMSELFKVDCFSEDYFINLRREMNGFHPKPNKIKDFIGISGETVSKLEKIGIKDTMALFDKVKPIRAGMTLQVKQESAIWIF